MSLYLSFMLLLVYDFLLWYSLVLFYLIVKPFVTLVLTTYTRFYTLISMLVEVLLSNAVSLHVAKKD